MPVSILRGRATPQRTWLRIKRSWVRISAVIFLVLFFFSRLWWKHTAIEKVFLNTFKGELLVYFPHALDRGLVQVFKWRRSCPIHIALNIDISLYSVMTILPNKSWYFVVVFVGLGKELTWAPSSEFVSSSISSWQILTAHAQPFRGARDLAFCLKVPLDSLLVWASSGCSGETARMHRLTWTVAARIGDKYQIHLTRSTLII